MVSSPDINRETKHTNVIGPSKSFIPPSVRTIKPIQRATIITRDRDDEDDDDDEDDSIPSNERSWKKHNSVGTVISNSTFNERPRHTR